jgi:hypothetical protein
MVDVEPDRRLEIVLAESLRALAHQQGLLDNLRSRATLLLTAAALVASFPGVSAATGGSAIGAATVLEMLGLAGVLLCTLVICAPWWRAVRAQEITSCPGSPGVRRRIFSSASYRCRRPPASCSRAARSISLNTE